MKTMKKALALMLAFVLVMGTAVVGFDGILALKASAAVDDPAALDGKLRVNSDGTFRILQVADMQENYLYYYRSVATIKYAIQKYNPNLIVLTGDNVNGTRRENRFDESVQHLVELFCDIPFAVTYGNHDVEENSSEDDRPADKCFSYKYQQAVYDKYGAIKLKQDGLKINDTTDYSSAKYGTGYIDIYGAAGTADSNTVVQRVIVLNSAPYEVASNIADCNVIGNSSSVSNYTSIGYGRVGSDAKTFKNNDYDNVVAAVNAWTSDPSITCIAYQHIPVQEVYPIEGMQSTLLKKDPNGLSSDSAPFPDFADDSIDPNNKYSVNTAVASGKFYELSGCSGFSTRALFNALAKDNVAGLFFGHDHVNTVTGIATTTDGKSLKLGYGGGLEVYKNSYTGGNGYGDYGRDVIDFESPRTSVYTLSTSSDDVVKTDTSYFDILRNYSISEYTGKSQTYVSDVRLFAADTAGAGHFDEAVAKCIAAGFIPVTSAYNTNNGSSTIEGDINKFSYANYGGFETAKAICLGYKLTNNVNDAITDIKFYDGDSAATMAATTSWDHQKIAGISEEVPYYNSNPSSTIVNANEGCTEDTNIWLFYKKVSDPDGYGTKVGRPIKKIFLHVGNVIEHVSFDPNSFVNEEPYGFASWLDRNNDIDALMNFGSSGNGTDYNIKWANDRCSAHIGMVYAMPEDDDLVVTPANNITETAAPGTPPTEVANPGTRPAEPGSFNTPTIVVPDTIYLTPAASATAFDKYLNNNTSGTAVAGYDDNNGYIYVKYSGATTSNVSVSCNGASVTYGTKTAEGDFIKIPITGGTMSTAVSASGVSTLTWIITVAGKTVGTAYTVVYAPNIHSVGATAHSETAGKNIKAANMSWISGIQTVTTDYTFGSRTGNTDPAGHFTYEPLLDLNTGHVEKWSGCQLVTTDSTVYATNYFRNNSSGNAYANSPDGKIIYDSSRINNLSQIPNLYVGTDYTGQWNDSNKYDAPSTHYRSFYLLSDNSSFATPTYSDNWEPSDWSVVASYTGNAKSNSFQLGSGVNVSSNRNDITSTSPTNSEDLNIKIDTGDKGEFRYWARWYLAPNGGLNNTMYLYLTTQTRTHSHNSIGGGVSNNTWCTTYAKVILSSINKSSLRNQVFNAMQLYEKADAVAAINSSYTYNGTAYTIDAATLQSKIAAAALELGNPTSQATSNSELTNYVAAINAAYTALQNAVDNYDINLAAYQQYLYDKAAYDEVDAAYEASKIKCSVVTDRYVSSSGKVLDSFSQGYRYNSTTGDTVTTRVRHYNGYTAPSAQAAWTADAEDKEITYTYTRRDYTITYVSNGSTFTTTPYTVENIGENCITLPGEPTLSGATFKGWKVKGVTAGSSTTESNWLVDTIYQPGDVTGYKYGNVTLEAVWDFTLRIDSNGGKTQNNLIYFKDGAMSATAANADMRAYLSYEADGDVTIFAQRFVEGTEETTLDSVAYVYLEAGKTYRVNYKSTSEKVEILLFTPDGKVCNMGCWNIDEGEEWSGEFTTGVNIGNSNWSESTNLTGEYSIRFDQNEYRHNGLATITNFRIVEVTQSTGVDNVIHQENGTTRLIQDPVRDYYTFKGWYTAASKGTVSPNMVNNNNGTYTYTFNSAEQTTYAQWTPIDYTITYNLDDGTNASANPATYNIETATFTLAAPTKTGYIFNGWTLTMAEGGAFASGSVLSGASASIVQGSHGNVTAAASWDKISNDDVFVLDAFGTVNLNVLDNDASGATLSGVSNVPTGVTATVENGKIKFTPGSVLTDVITFNYTASGSTATVKIIPATSVYYEETSGFVTFNGAWTNDGTAATAIAEARTPGSATYGDLGGIYDDTNSSEFSMGSAKKYTVSMSNINRNGDGYAAFTFTGTGFEVYSVTNNDCGYFEIDVTGTKTNDAGEKLVDLALFDNNYYGYSYGKLYLKDGKITHDSTGTPLYKTTADDKSAGTIPFEDGRLTTNKPSGASQASGWTPVNNTETTEGLYQIPVISVKNLDYDTYTVKITPKYSPVQDMLYRQGSTNYSFWFDSVKIFDPIDPDSIIEGSDIYNAYFEDRELNAGSQKIRNILIDKKNAGEVSGEGIGFFTVFDGSNAEAPGVIGTMADIAEYKEVGPNNEVYLEPGKAIGFNITTGSNVIPTKVSVGVKMIKSGTSGKLTVNGSQEINVSIPTELYREITGIEWKMSGDVYTTKSPIIIKNDSDSGVIISLTDIRWSYGKSNVAPAKAPIRFTFDPALVNAYMSQAAEADAIAEQTVEYEGVNIEWNKSEVELGETASLVITTPEEIIKVTVDGEEISNFEILEDGSKRWTYTVDAAALGGVEYDVVLYDENGYNSKSLPTGVCRIVEPKVDIGDAVITWDKSEITLGETATLSVETNEKIAAVIIGDERVTDFSLEDGRKTFALDITPDELGKYKYTVILEEYHGYTSTSVKSDALTVIGYTVSTDDIDIQWKSGTVETGAEAELIIRTPADIAKVIVDGHELTAFETLESGEKQWTYAITVEKTGELEYSIRFIDENGMESSSVSSGVLKVELPQEDPDDDENLTFWQKLIRFFRNLFSKIVTFVKGLVK